MPRSRSAAQAPEKRTKNFNEVDLGFSKRVALEEARRCPQCPEPACVSGCPLGIDIPAFIRMLRENDVTGAYEKIKESNCLPSICGRICTAPCEEACILNKDKAPIEIRVLERFVADSGKSWRFKKEKKDLRGKRVAIIGSGPCGLTAGFELVQQGYQVVIFESFDKAGGVLRYGVPDFRLPKKVLDGDINEIKAAGAEIEQNFLVGQTATIQELFSDGFSAILLATGAGIPKFKEIPGSHLAGVYYGEEFLMRSNLMKTTLFQKNVPTFHVGEKVVVVGSGNTALDCARVARRFDRDVTLLFRRTEDEMRVRDDLRIFAQEEGIHFEPLAVPVEILADHYQCVNGLKCIRMDFADSGPLGKWKLAPVPDSEFVLEADTVIVAVGHYPNASAVKDEKDIKLTNEKTVKVSEKTMMTSRQGVFAAGNIVCNSQPLVDNIAAGKEAAEKIADYLK